jgi:type I restriction enzyme S subunit
VLFGKRRAYQRKVAVADFDAICSGDIYVFETEDQTQLLQELLPYICQTDSFFEYAVGTSAGSLSPRTNWKSLAAYEFALPPLEEQRRILKALQGSSALTNEFVNTLQVAESARDSLVVELYKYGIRGESTKMTSIGLVPRSWSIEPLGNRYSIQLGKMISKAARLDENDGSHIPYLRNANVQWNKFELDDVASMTFTQAEREKFSLRSGDILACEGRHVGKSAIWCNEIPGACYQKALHRLRAIGNDIPEFLLHCLYFFSITGRFAALTGETTIPHLPAERLRAIHVAFPSVEEQEEIARVIGSFDSGLESLNKRAGWAKSLIGSLDLEAK